MKKMLPGSVCDFQRAPLHVAVAMWGLREGILLTDISIARAFGIRQAQARDLLQFITRDAREFIDSEAVNLIDIHGQKTRAIRILSVYHGAMSVPPTGIRYRPVDPPQTPKTFTIQDEDPITTLRRWMCSRRTGETPPEKGEKNEPLSD